MALSCCMTSLGWVLEEWVACRQQRGRGSEAEAARHDIAAGPLQQTTRDYLNQGLGINDKVCKKEGINHAERCLTPSFSLDSL